MSNNNKHNPNLYNNKCQFISDLMQTYNRLNIDLKTKHNPNLYNNKCQFTIDLTPIYMKTKTLERNYKYYEHLIYL